MVIISRYFKRLGNHPCSLPQSGSWAIGRPLPHIRTDAMVAGAGGSTDGTKGRRPGKRSVPCRFRRIGGATGTVASVGNSLLSGSSFRDELAETGFCLTIGLNSLSAFAQGLPAERACRQNPTMITVPPTPEESVPACGRRVRKRVAMIVLVVACHISPGRFTGPPWSEPHDWQLAS